MPNNADLSNLQIELQALRAELSQLKASLNVQPVSTIPVTTSSTRRKILGKLAAGLLFGLGAVTLTNSPAEAKFYSTPYSGAFTVSPTTSSVSGSLASGRYGVIGAIPGANLTTVNLANVSLAASYNLGLIGFCDETIFSGFFVGVGGEGTVGVLGKTKADTASGRAIYGIATSANAYAGYFSGKVQVNGELAATSKNFKIDHPLDPANKYLYHTSIESDERLNLYSGNVTLDAAGTATVTFPNWFTALNKDLRYQLTPLGAACSTLHVLPNKSGNAFQIAGGTPGLQVSWFVAGIRNDHWAEKHPTIVEEPKPETERGLYLHPELYGHGLEKSVNSPTRKA